MTMALNDDIERLVVRLESETPPEDAYFAILRISEVDESYIQANAFGLQRFAAELLKASLKADEVIADKEQSTIPFGPKVGFWIDGDVLLDYVEPVIEKPEDVADGPDEPHEEAWQDKALGLGCLASVFFILLLIIVGVITVIRWLF